MNTMFLVSSENKTVPGQWSEDKNVLERSHRGYIILQELDAPMVDDAYFKDTNSDEKTLKELADIARKKKRNPLAEIAHLSEVTRVLERCKFSFVQDDHFIDSDLNAAGSTDQ